MTFEEFYSKFWENYNQNNQGQRKGQFFINFLGEFSKKLYYRIPPDIDCFYSDDLFDQSVNWVMENWNKD
jgi:hypothetical protein